jgi:hypothetical protein
VAPDRELERLGKAMDSTRRMLELVEATEEQLAAQGRGQPGLERGGPGASMEVRNQSGCSTTLIC